MLIIYNSKICDFVYESLLKVREINMFLQNLQN